MKSDKIDDPDEHSIMTFYSEKTYFVKIFKLLMTGLSPKRSTRLHYPYSGPIDKENFIVVC